MTPGPRRRLDDVETLSDYEARRAKEGGAARRPPPRIACDRCGTELEDEQRLTYYGDIRMLGVHALYHAIRERLNRPVRVWCPECGAFPTAAG